MTIFTEAINASKSFVSLTGTVGIAGFVFDISNDATIELTSEITDHYLEDGTAIQDHIALKPEKVTLSGYCGEYRNIISEESSTLQTITEKLITVSSYLPALSDAANTTREALTSQTGEASVVAGYASDLFKSYRDINIPQDRQSEAFIYFEALRNARQTFTIQTPYRYYTNMAIESLRATQTGATKDESSFEVTFKRLRFIETTSTSLVDNAQGRLKNQISSTVNKGITKGKEVDTSVYEKVTSIWS